MSEGFPFFPDYERIRVSITLKVSAYFGVAKLVRNRRRQRSTNRVLAIDIIRMEIRALAASENKERERDEKRSRERATRGLPNAPL